MRKGNALLALGRYAEANGAANRALAMSPTALEKQVAQIKRKCAKKTKAAASSKPAKSPAAAPAAVAKAEAEDVHSFAKRLVTAAMSCGACDPAKSKFEGAHLHLSLLSSGKEKRLHVADLYKKYIDIADAPGRARS